MQETTHETDEDQESDVVEHWALKLINSLTGDDLESLKSMKGPGTESRTNAARKLQKRVLEIRPELLPKAKSKTGPKTRDSHNQTDEEISVLYDVIRMILELDRNANIPDIRNKLIKTLKDAQSYLTEHLLLTAIEARSIERNLQSWMDSKTCLPPWLSLQKACEQIKQLKREIDPAPLARAVNKHKSPEEENSENKRTRKEAEDFVELARVMELHKAPMQDLEKVIIHQYEEEACIEYPKFDSIAVLKLKRKGLLWSAVGRLTNLKTLFCDTSFEWTPSNLDLLQDDIQIATMPFIKPRTVEPSASVEPSTNEIRLRELKRVISSASARQGVSPFSGLLAGCERKLPLSSRPGQILR